MSNECWHQRQRAELTAARQRVAAMDSGIMVDFFKRLDRCRECLAASDEAMRRHDYKEAIKHLKEELLNERTSW